MKALILKGYGINCEKEMAHACSLAGFESVIIHTQSLFTENVDLNRFHLICFPGGFSFGDELGAGKVFANRIAYAKQTEGIHLKEKLEDFVESGKCILGICNGFQLLVKLGLLPGSLAHNDSGKFEDRWVYHRVPQSNCIFTKGLTQLFLPIRHGEGKYLPSTVYKIALQYAIPTGEATMDYPANPNGSAEAVAAITDTTGRILGMMAHPEAALYFKNDPRWLREKERRQRRGQPIPEFADGFAIFHNAFTYLKEIK